MWHGSRSTATCMPIAPVSTRSRRHEARDDHDLKTSKWQEDKVHETVELEETNTPDGRVAGTVEVKRQEQRGPASPSTSRRTRNEIQSKSSKSKTPEPHRKNTIECRTR